VALNPSLTVLGKGVGNHSAGDQKAVRLESQLSNFTEQFPDFILICYAPTVTPTLSRMRPAARSCCSIQG
jgi:hypothetical protein